MLVPLKSEAQSVDARDNNVRQYLRIGKRLRSEGRILTARPLLFFLRVKGVLSISTRRSRHRSLNKNVQMQIAKIYDYEILSEHSAATRKRLTQPAER
jgi:hypothetical protein